MTIPADPADAAATEAQVEDFIARFTPKIAARARACRAALAARLPTATQPVYDNYNALAIGFGANDRVSGVAVSLAIYPRNVLLYFARGASLADPKGVLKGEGRQGRYVCMIGPETLADPAVAALLDAALDQADPPLPASGGGRTVVKSISAKQRPRRPKEAA